MPSGASEKVMHAANQLMSSCFKKFSREAIITAGFVEFKPLNGYGHLFGLLDLII